LIVDCTRPEPLAKAATELLLDAGRREAMGRAGRELVLERFDWPPLAAKAAEILGLAEPSSEMSRAAIVRKPAEAVVA
jgi:glycosyltransferase involved in cell wall biosynthesis